MMAQRSPHSQARRGCLSRMEYWCSSSPGAKKMAAAASSTKRKAAQKRVVRVRLEEDAEVQKVNRPPSDSWTWRKYGQKPIKGSPYPRGYYKCSSCKGCPAKKQVERCRTDACVLIVTYTSAHNHPCPDATKLKQPPTPAGPISPPAGRGEEASTGGVSSSHSSPPSATTDGNDFFDELEDLVPISSSSPPPPPPLFFFDDGALLPS